MKSLIKGLILISIFTSFAHAKERYNDLVMTKLRYSVSADKIYHNTDGSIVFQTPVIHYNDRDYLINYSYKHDANIDYCNAIDSNLTTLNQKSYESSPGEVMLSYHPTYKRFIKMGLLAKSYIYELTCINKKEKLKDVITSVDDIATALNKIGVLVGSNGKVFINQDRLELRKLEIVGDKKFREEVRKALSK